MERLKLYIDTNIILDIFISQAKAFRKGSEFTKPKKFEFMLKHSDKIEFLTSFLTKAEVMRELLTAYHFDVKQAEKMWDDFVNTLETQVHIENFRFDSNLVDIVCKIRLKLRTLFNFMHLFIAMKENAYFVSGDKDIILKIKENQIYDKTLSYIELRKLISSLDSSQDA